ncbi:TBC domain-containing protein kinase-like protein [Teleopsis dalmanni]|uniref:TBC domain-containing protein kinase-like protein n=1 Tax=Teleopsis dalmanni TaxID=139649 RepID=UPI0018CE29A0|nr:TBC domain-containing protein kinase-like protein [Teleopsis dalmanni]XP_037938050.1 TBC domain-containing protein kinase-like protein [Teleopsis dalmanni]
MSPSAAKPETRLAATTFFAKTHPGDVCGSNGLPLTPNSIAILGRSQRLKELHHENLCQYIDIIRGKHERTIVVSEYFGTTLQDKSKNSNLSEEQIVRIFYQVARGIEKLHKHKLVVHNLEPKHILLDQWDNAKLFNYGLFYMTNGGEYVPFPIGNIKYMPPERLVGGKNNIKSDIWSLGMIVAELLLKQSLWPNLKISAISRKILSFCQSNSVFEKISREHDCLELYQQLDVHLREAVDSCLCLQPAGRPLPEILVTHTLFQKNLSKYCYTVPEKPKLCLLRCPLEQIYYFWQLAGGDVQAELKKEGLIRSEAPILAIPQVVCLNGSIAGPKRSQSYLMDDRVVPLKLNNLIERLRNLTFLAYFPIIHSKKLVYNFGSGMEQLPLVIREKDIEYQFYRVRLLSRLLKGYPYTTDLILKEAAVDIPPLLRGQIWACLLGVIPNGSYMKIDKFTATSTDRQIEVDIPRCHQYDELLSSPSGHRKLKLLLKAWVTAHPYYVYWQGLDSLTAPFLYLNFNNEELAFLSLYKFIPKYLQWFFLKDNSAIIKEYLCKFSQLTAFHEPILARHLASINFIPELFAIPWFLTMFSHVFPLHKILHLWDKLMLGDNSYPLFIGISILRQLKNTLLGSGFNECILLFSDLPDIVMENCVVESQKMYELTPKSVSQRTHMLHTKQLGEFDISTDVTLTHLQMEMSPRISANNFVHLLLYAPQDMISLDIRSVNEYARARVDNSINIPFVGLQLDEPRLEALNVQNLEQKLRDRIVVCISTKHDDSVEFSRFLVYCGIERVCILHKGFNILHTIEPNILISN